MDRSCASADLFAPIDPDFREQACRLNELFDAQSVAVVGASNSPTKASHHVIRTMQDEGFEGRIFPVNPSEDTVLGLRCYPSLAEIEEEVELVVVSIPTRFVLSVVEQAAARGDVGFMVILTAGFAETAIADNVTLEKQIVDIASAAGIRIVGPNCIGVINPRTKLCTGFAPGLTLTPGKIGLITQSGALGGAFLMACGSQPSPLGFSRFGHVGNMSDVDIVELLLCYAGDAETKAISMYMEGIRDGRHFLRIAREVTQEKPVFVLKVGRNALGSRAAMSHTGALAGSDRIYDAALRQVGIERILAFDDLVDVSKAAAYLPAPAGNRVCVLTQAGGPGIIAMDEIGHEGSLCLAPLDPSTRSALEDLLPPMAMICKPDGYIDMTAAAMADVHARALQIVLDDPNVDSVVFITLPPTFLPAMDVARAVAPVASAASKPVVTCFMHGHAMLEARAHLEHLGVPTFDAPDRAARALIHLTHAWNHQSKQTGGSR